MMFNYDEVRVWFDPQKSVIGFMSPNDRCLDFFVNQNGIKVELYEGEDLVEGGIMENREISMEQVYTALTTMDLTSLLKK
ncbi:MAG: hypothetical protein M1129_01850 [Candidatus Thermoplasmatota archaeon]|jgi:hypothetical protein|nr:hypothetical protein [Candidatus Thermoplasmatota archaeon]